MGPCSSTTGGMMWSKIGEVLASYLEEITEGLWHKPVSVEVNRRVMDERYDLILSPGQVVSHEVIGMANHSKNLFVGVGGSDMINSSMLVHLDLCCRGGRALRGCLTSKGHF